MAFPLSKTPVVLFPLKVETRFIRDELWIRAFPDEIFLQSHDPRLSREERVDAVDFKQLSTEADKRAGWDQLVAKYGAYRSAWLVQITQEALDQQTAAAAQDGEKPDNQEPSFYFKWLPDRLVTYLFREGETTPAYKEEGAVIDRAGLPILSEGDEWIEDFAEAVKVGMGMKIKLSNPTTDIRFEKVIVTGIRYAEDPLVPARGLADLFQNHQYTEGFSFLEYGTPTNNTAKEKSGHSIRAEFDAAASFEHAVNGFEPIPAGGDPENYIPVSAGTFLAHSLGIEPSDLKHVDKADLTDPDLNYLYQKATWFAQGGQTLFMLFGEQISSEMHVEIWKHYSDYVKAKGPNTALKVGNQPYGVLPVMGLRKILEDETIAEAENAPGAMAPLLVRLFERWQGMAKYNLIDIPRLGDAVDSYTELLKVLSMQEHSTSYQFRTLEYDRTRAKFQNWLRYIPPFQVERDWRTLLATAPLLQNEINALQPNIDAIDQIAAGYYDGPDGLLQVPLLGFKDGGETSLEEAGLAFTQEDLTDLKNFIQELEDTSDFSIIQYRGELSVFTELFLRSFINACQLYYRDVHFEPAIIDLQEYSLLTIGQIPMQENSTVSQGELILEITGGKAGIPNTEKTIQVRAPFSGRLEKLHVTQGAEVLPGQRLFRLINEAKYQEIRDTFISLGYQIVATCEAITDPEKRLDAQRISIREVVDLNSYRLDAWLTSLSARRIQEMRAVSGFEKGIYFGAYGWVEHLTKDLANPIDADMNDTYGENGGIIHTPGSAQAVASAIFKNSFLSNRQNGANGQNGNPFMLNLTSDRIQKSGFLLEGIRQGQKVEALLGYQLERYLHEHRPEDLHNEIYQLRKAYPLEENASIESGSPQTAALVQLSVIDGIKAINNKDSLPVASGKKAIVKQYIEKLEDTLDGSLDSLFYEAGYQVTQGNISQAAAALDATKGAIDPPEIDSLKTKIPGVGIRHKIALIFTEPATPFDIKNSKAFVEPVLENWLMEQLGDFANIGCEVHLTSPDETIPPIIVPVTLSDLGIGYLDFLYLSDDPVSDGASELELRIWHFVQEQGNFDPENLTYYITDIPPPACQSLSHALEVARYANECLNRCRYLRSEDITLEEETIHYHKDALNRIKTDRLIPLINKLKNLQDADLTHAFLMEDLSRLDINEAGKALFADGAIDLGKLKQEIAKKAALAEAHIANFNFDQPFYTAFEHLQAAARVLFGKAFILLPPAAASDQFHQIISSNSQHLLVGKDSEVRTGQEVVQNWMEGIAQVRENTEAFENWQMVKRAWQDALSPGSDTAWHIVQGPTLLQYPWVGLSKTEIDTVLQENYQAGQIYVSEEDNRPYPLADGSYYPEGCESVILDLPDNFSFEKNGQKTAVYGLVVEEFSEHIPDEKVDTGVSFHYNAPDSEPPQSILLAVHPKSMMESSFFWSEDDLKDILYDTMDLYKVRLVDLEAMRDYGAVLPMTVWPNLPNGQ
ncbi:MAG: hypothetical protein R2824_19695 [Saprospiraceae bacterium]|nr:lipoyl domain-containing protein [Lewinella sp.]